MEAYKQLFNAVISELNTDYYTIENAQKVINRSVYWDEKQRWMMRKYKYSCSDGWNVVGRGYGFRCIFGYYYFEREDIKLLHKVSGKRSDENKTERYYYYRWLNNIGRCGIEILGMKPDRTKDGKYTFKGCIMKELKQSCKMNNIKGYSKMDKCDIVKELMRI
jgi:hypothetical protein